MKEKGSECGRSQYKILFVLVSAIYWCTFLLKSDSYYVPYLFLGIAGGICFVDNFQKNIEFLNRADKIMTRCYGMAFSLMVTLANYGIFLNDQMPTGYNGHFFEWIYKIISVILVYAGGYFIFTQILMFLYGWEGLFSKRRNNSVSKQQYKIKSWQIFLGAWIIIAVVNLIVMFSTMYPGILTADSMWQMEQLLNKSYSNHHPYYHTQIIHVMISFGYRVFGNINAAVAVYSVFSIIVMAFCFAYVVYTIFQMKHSLKIVAVVFIWYLIMPFHIIYSFTMWKDVFFGASITLFVVGMFRIMKKVGNYLWLDYMVILCAAFGVCLLRNNGWLVFVLSTLVFGILFWEKQKKMFIMFVGIIMISFVLKYPVLNALNVAPTGRMESLSIPAQQIARVIADGKKLTTEQEELLSKVVDIHAIPETYSSYISDPIKVLVNARGNQDYINKDKISFIKLYLQLGLMYPQKYVEAWIDQTRGYWNAGYPYWKWKTGVLDNSLGIEGMSETGFAGRMLQEYLWVYENLPILQIFVCIGFFVWLVLFSTYRALSRRDFIAFFMSVPHLMIILSLLVATPVFSEFRYAYPVFCSIPFIILVSFSSYSS